jgi:hypothetical protein
MIFAIYWLLVLEGALRKWGLPQLEQAFFFIRLPITLALYWIAFRFRRWPHTNRSLLTVYVLAAAATVLATIQLLAGGYDPRYLLLVGYGWVNYFFYVPLAFLIAAQFRWDDLQRLTRHTLWLALAAAPIVVLQFFSPADSVINLGSGLEDANQFKNLGAALGFVRPTGFFTSTLGQAQFVASAAALLLATFLQPRSARKLNPVFLWLGGVAIVSMLVFSQSRGLILSAGLVLLAAAIAGMLTGKRRVVLRACIVPLAAVGGMALLGLLVFPNVFEVFVVRWAGAWYAETQTFQLGIFGRALYGFYSFIYYLPDTPLAGYLLGLGGNAASQLEWVRMPSAAIEWHGYGAWAEGGWERHVIELGPVLGLAFILFRLALTVWLGLRAVRATRRSGEVLPLVLFGYVGIVLLYGQITGHGTVNGYAWMFFGFCLAAARCAERNRRWMSLRPPIQEMQSRAA